MMKMSHGLRERGRRLPKAVAVRQLGYIGVHTTQVEKWRTLLVDYLGATEVRVGDDGSSHFRFDEWSQRLSIIPDSREELAFLGFEVMDGAALSALVARLEASGHEVKAANQADCDERGVAELCRLKDPSGITLEIFHGSERTPTAPGGGTATFKCGELGLGHAVVTTPHYDDALRFYRDELGFRVSDWIKHPQGWDATFLRCNPRHHTLALVRQPAPSPAARLDHFLLEVTDIDDVGRALDHCALNEVPIVQSLGRHTNDLMISFYLETPSGFEIEYGTGGREITDDDSWTPEEFDSPSIWGHYPRATFD